MSTSDSHKPTGSIPDKVLQETDSDLVRAIFLLLRLLLNGKPVSADRFATSFGLSHAEVDALFAGLRVWGAEFDEAGNFAGAGITLIPTPHRYEVNGRRFFTWCAPDTLLFPIMFGHIAAIESTDPVSYERILATISPRGVEHIEPPTAVLTSRRGGDARDVRGSMCQFGHFFTSRTSAAEYVAHHGGAVGGVPLDILTPTEAFDNARALTDLEPFRDIRWTQ
jgi:alkylmercury lyase